MLIILLFLFSEVLLLSSTLSIQKGNKLTSSKCFLHEPTSPLSDEKTLLTSMRSRFFNILPKLLIFGFSSEISKAADDNFYVDDVNKFSLVIPPSWFITTKKISQPTLAMYLPEESLFIASSFAEASSMSVTKTNAPRLMKDFDVEWWFVPLTKMSDIGPANFISNLLILQRQGEFEKKVTPSEILKAAIDEQGYLEFEFKTPLNVEGVYRMTIGKGFLRKNELFVVWISALSDVMVGDYGPTLRSISDSFHSTV